MRILLFGGRGQLGTALANVLPVELVAPGRDAVDLANAAAVRNAIEQTHPDAVINAAAYNFVDRAEEEFEQAFAVNAFGVRNLAHACAQAVCPLMHVSTDYVFGFEADRAEPYSETDPPGPLGVYGASKLAGEYFVRALCPKHFVLRTCGLYGRGMSPGKGNFVETMLRLGAERGEVSVVDDQWCTPTSAAGLARSIASLIGTDRYGLYHATCAGSTTWRRFAEEIFRQAGMNVSVKPITTAQFGAKARRPRYSVLDCSKLATTVGRPMPPWEEALAEYLGQRGAHVGA